MTITIKRLDFRFVEIPKEDRKDNVALDSHALTPMQSFLLRMVGDAIRNAGTEEFWNRGYYSWWEKYPQEGKCLEFRVFLNEHNMVVYEDCQTGQMFLVLESD